MLCFIRPVPRVLPIAFFSTVVTLTFLLATPQEAQAQKTQIKKPVPPKAQIKVKPVIKTPTGEALIKALEDEDTVRALVLVKQGADPNAKSDNGWDSALTLASGLGDVKLVQALLEKGAVVKPIDWNGAIPLINALTSGSEDIARLLVEKGADVNDRGSDQENSPLSLAAANGWMPLVTLFLDKGAEINRADGNGVTPLSAAARYGQLAVMQYLVGRGAPVSKDADLVGASVASGKVEIVQFLLDRGAVLTGAPQGTTFLHLAARSGSVTMLQKVLDTGADVEAVDADGETALMDAAHAGKAASVAFLISKKARPDALSPEYKTALDIAVAPEPGEGIDKAARAETIAALKKAGAKPAPPSLWKAAVDTKLPQLRDFLAKGADPNLQDAFKAVPLFYVIGHSLSSEAGPLTQALLESGANPNATAPDGRSLVDFARDEKRDEAVALLRQAGADTPELDLTEAVERDDQGTINRLLEKNVVPESDALVLAIYKKDDHVLLKRLLAAKAKVNAPTRRTGNLFSSAPSFPLHAAAQAGDLEAVRLLLEHGADPNIRKDKEGSTPLMVVSDVSGTTADIPEDEQPEKPSPEAMIAAEKDADAVVHLLVEHGADVHAYGRDGMTGSVLAHLAGSVPTKTLEFLLSKGAAPDINIPSGDTESAPPLLAAVRLQRVDNVRFLLERGANPNMGLFSLRVRGTPLMELAEERKTTPEAVAIAKLLLEHGAQLDVKDSEGRNALRMAEESHNKEIAALIRAAGGTKASISPASEMSVALWQSDIKTVARLLKEGFDPNGLAGGKDVLLYEAGFAGSLDIVRLLLEHGADVNRAGELGTPLHGAAAGGDVEIVRLLLARGAKPDADDGFSGTPLVRAAEEGNLAVMRLLLKAGADPSARASAYPGAPLESALKKGGDAAVDLLLKAGANPNLGYPLGVPLFFGDVGTIERLVRAGAKINNQNAFGRTVLMDAAVLGQKDIVAWLIDHKANVNLKDKEGHTALSEAIERDKTECVRLLRKAGAK